MSPFLVGTSRTRPTLPIESEPDVSRVRGLGLRRGGDVTVRDGACQLSYGEPNEANEAYYESGSSSDASAAAVGLVSCGRLGGGHGGGRHCRTGTGPAVYYEQDPTAVVWDEETEVSASAVDVGDLGSADRPTVEEDESEVTTRTAEDREGSLQVAIKCFGLFSYEGRRSVIGAGMPSRVNPFLINAAPLSAYARAIRMYRGVVDRAVNTWLRDECHCVECRRAPRAKRSLSAALVGFGLAPSFTRVQRACCMQLARVNETRAARGARTKSRPISKSPGFGKLMAVPGERLLSGPVEPRVHRPPESCSSENVIAMDRKRKTKEARKGREPHAAGRCL
ncbi:hypothetical protein HPB48_009456 [Haemaphysalis longicornis]|uniref:Uncharacterized protein n=1 Tax=Haemaphysalis longicornis TaxID=44386 RepID=A0A9J6GE39_HAELO|nr:hypothetical protein HPB48_009456 [Haemaphysalis longicornis]